MPGTLHPYPAVLALILSTVCGLADAPSSSLDTKLFDELPLVLEIDTVTTRPSDEIPIEASQVESILGQRARTLPMGAEARRMVFRIGADKELKAGATYLLDIEYPDDEPRAFFVANRAADFVHGWATGTATGDARRQYVEPSLESLNYPHSGKWQHYRQLFVMQERLQGLLAHRNPDPGGRPFEPADGFHLIFFQTYVANDPRSRGIAIGKIRLFAVPDPKRLYAPLRRPPAELPQRRVFWREEMSDQAVSAAEATNRAFADPLDWYRAKLQLAKVLGIDTFTKDLLEFGFNQGWESGDQNWVVDAQPPLKDLWTRLVPVVASEGFTILPYYEYKGGIGIQSATPPSLGWQRRAQKLYHGKRKTGDDPQLRKYTSVWWAEDHDADLTDPDTLTDFKRVLERTILRFGNQARFEGVWLRTRPTHLPISFGQAAIARFQETLPGLGGQQISQELLISSYEGDQVLYGRYIEWWLKQRAEFLSQIQSHLTEKSGHDLQVIFTPWPGEPVPGLLKGDSSFHTVGLVTDEPNWWNEFAKQQKDDWFRWKWVPSAWEEVVTNGWWARSLSLRQPINDSGNWDHAETYHSAPGADPEHYGNRRGVTMSYPIGRLFTVAGTEPINQYRSGSGPTVVHHYTLNENDEHWEKMDAGTRSAQPFQNVAGYAAVDVERAGSHVMLGEARAVAFGDPSNIGFLCSANFSTGFPLEMRRFIQAFVAVPALPSRVLSDAASDREVIVREIPTKQHGTYYYVVNTSWSPKAVRVNLGSGGAVTDAVTGESLKPGELSLTINPAELRAFQQAVPASHKK